MEEKINFNTYSHNFGLLIPKETGVNFVHQGGGMSCVQNELEGIFYPMKTPTMHVGSPEWVDLEEDISDIDLTREEIPEYDFNSFPEWVQERGHFYNYDEYFYWLNKDEVEWYGTIDLNREQRLWNYDPSGELIEESQGYNPLAKWGSLKDIWKCIDDALPFTYENFDAFTYKAEKSTEKNIPRSEVELPIPDGYDKYDSSFKWIKIIKSKENDRGKKLAPWADKLSGEYVILTYTNCD